MQKLNTKPHDASLIAMQALVWAISDEARAERLLSLTGLTPGSLRAGITDPALQAAILGFLESHEPDLIACAVAIDVSPAALVAARRELEGGEYYE
jgi:hypothetical protein